MHLKKKALCDEANLMAQRVGSQIIHVGRLYSLSVGGYGSDLHFESLYIYLYIILWVTHVLLIPQIFFHRIY